MSRTYRRRGQTHEYRWVLRDRSDATMYRWRSHSKPVTWRPLSRASRRRAW